MWLLVRNPDGTHVLFRCMIHGVDLERVKRGYRRDGGAVVAVYRLKHPEPTTYGSED